MNAVLKYPGSKNRVAQWIIGNMPRHEVYVELFGGSAAVLLNKNRCHIETFNDLDGEVVNFFRVLRDHHEELERLIQYTPYSREEYDLSYQDSENEVERARRFCVRCWQGFGCGNLYHNGFKSGQQAKSPNPAAQWGMLPYVMEEAAKRLRGVQIENLPALGILKRYNTPDVFIYADPPYLHESRKNYLYKHEMSDVDHEELLQALLDHPGPVLLSGYDNDLYNQTLKGWKKAQKSTLAERGLKRTETLWMNYNIGQMTLADIPGVMP